MDRGASLGRHQQGKAMGKAVHGLRVLCVGQLQQMQNLLSDLLAAAGITKIAFQADGASAIGAMKHEDYDVVLIADACPASAASRNQLLTFMRDLRGGAADINTKVPVVMIAEQADKHFMRQARDNGVTDFVGKPVTGARLSAAILHVVGRVGAGAMPRRVESDSPAIEAPAAADSPSPDNGVAFGAELEGGLTTLSPQAHALGHGTVAAMQAELSSRLGSPLQASAGQHNHGAGEALSETDRLGRTYAAASALSESDGPMDFPLVSRICTTLCRYLEQLGVRETADSDVLRAHANALRAVIGNRIEGDGGHTGRDLIEGLEALVIVSAQRNHAIHI